MILNHFLVGVVFCGLRMLKGTLVEEMRVDAEETGLDVEEIPPHEEQTTRHVEETRAKADEHRLTQSPPDNV